MGQKHGALLDVHHVVAAFGLILAEHQLRFATLFNVCAALKPAHEFIDLGVHIGGLFTMAGDNQRRSCLVDQDGVHLVNNGVIELALHHLLFINNHVVAQIVKPQLVVGAVGDVAVVRGTALIVVEVVDDAPNRKPQKAENFTHPLRIALGEVIVYGHDVHTLSGKRIQIRGQSFCYGFTLARFHFGNAPLVEHDTA